MSQIVDDFIKAVDGIKDDEKLRYLCEKHILTIWNRFSYNKAKAAILECQDALKSLDKNHAALKYLTIGKKEEQ